MNLNATILGQMISFILFILFCMQYIWPKLINIIESRKEKIHNSMLIIKQSDEKIKLLQKVSNEMLHDTKKKSNLIIQNAKKVKKIIIRNAKISAIREREEIISNAYSEIKLQKIKIKEELIKEISYLSIQMTNKIINNSFNNNKDDQNIFNIIKDNI